MARRIQSYISLFMSVVISWTLVSAPVYAISQEQVNLYRQGVLYFDLEKCQTQANSQLYGNDNPEKVWNYFKTQGLQDVHIAAIMGNIQQESGFNPIIIQTARDGSGGGTSQNPRDADPLGWGLAQWTPGSKVLSTADKYGVTGTIYDLSTQLEIIWEEMSNETPTGYKNFIPDFTAITTLEAAVEFYSKNFEGAGNPILSNRVSFAQQALAKYGNGSTGTTSASQTTLTSSGAAGCASSNSYISPDCQNAQGNAKILCAAKAYDAASYKLDYLSGHQGGASWHSTCPVIDASCYLDCSGLVNIALFDMTGGQVDKQSVVADYANLSDLWEEITFEELQAGDLLVKIIPGEVNHVEIFDHMEGQQVYTFGAHNDSVPQEDQVGQAIVDPANYNYYYRYIGPGL